MPASIRKASQMKSFGWILTMLSMASSACFAFPLASLRKVHPTFALYSYDPEQESKLDVTFNRAKLEEKFMTTKDEDEKMRLLQEHYDSMIPVRFINYDQIGGSTKLAYAVPGTNILKIADVSYQFCEYEVRHYELHRSQLLCFCFFARIGIGHSHPSSMSNRTLRVLHLRCQRSNMGR